MEIIKSNVVNKNYSGFIRYVLAVAALHITGIALLMTGIHRYPQILGMAILSYTLGLRHAFDADHIAAIDNTVRKLVQQRENPKGVGFFFFWTFYSSNNYGSSHCLCGEVDTK